jgi:cysteine desulfurase/selenocysteine lyase
LLVYATQRLQALPGLQIIGNARQKASVVSFTLEGLSTLDVGMELDRLGICVRTGHHCCQPVMDRFGISATVRASFAFYNTLQEVDALAAALAAIAEARATRDKAKPAGGQIAYPAPTARSVAAAADALAEEFELLGDRDAKNEYLLDMARQLPHLFSLLSRVTARVPGCMSQVYLVGRKKQGSGSGAQAVFEFVADADAEIVRGLIALLQKIYSGQSARDAAAFDIEGFFGRIGLEQFITSQRRNGLAGMVAKIRGLAREIADAG